MANKKRLDPDTEAALAVVEVEQRQEELQRTEQEQREHAIAQCHEVIGRIQGLNIMSKLATVANLVWLKEVKAQKIYRDLPNIGTWENFCDYIKLDRRTVDESLQNLATFGEEFLATVANFGVGYRELRKLRQINASGDMTIDAEFVVIGEDRIPLDKDHTEDLEAAIESLLENKNRAIEEQKAAIKAKDRVLKDKEKKIQSLATEVSRLEGRAERAGYAPGEEAFLLKMNAALVQIDGFLMDFDPEKNPLPEDATPRMRASYMETLGYFKRITDAAFDIASEMYGDPEIDDGWVPPHKREPEDMTPEMRRTLGLPASPDGLCRDEGPASPEGSAEAGDCSKCRFHKVLSNKAAGVKIPGGFGKCTRPEGHCNPSNPNRGF